MSDDKVPAPALEAGKAPEAEEKKEEELGGKMSFIEHLGELRRRLIVTILTVAGCFFVIYSTDEVETIAYYFMKPLKDVVAQYGHFQYTSMAEGFMFNVKMASFAAVFVSMPMIFYQAWAFVAPGLYKRERRYVGPFILFSTLFFAAGAAFFYFIAFPMGAQFFASFANPGWIEFNPKLEDTFSFVILMLFAFGIIFELPLVAFLLARLRIINVGFLNKNRKYAVLVIFIVAAIITPPDVVSQLLVAFPMWTLYELSVLVVWLFGPRAPKEEATEPTGTDSPPP
jgi:sec-independent protein translocase protein TatC